MWRLIFLGLIIWLGINLLKRHMGQIEHQKYDAPKPADATDSKNHEEIENMVKCATCEVHLPRSEAYLVGGNFYCSKLHIPK